jgi:hypothetical protein
MLDVMRRWVWWSGKKMDTQETGFIKGQIGFIIELKVRKAVEV